MFYEIFKFEVIYRAKRTETYLYFFILLGCSLVAVDFVFQGTGEAIKPDAPYIIAFTMAVTSAIFTMVASMIMGVSILRDFDHRMESLMFVNPISKSGYLLGRFLGSFIVLLFVFSGLLFGMMLGSLMPWRDANESLPFNFWHYAQPFICIVVPNLFFVGCLFFASGALSRKLIVVYTQGILLLVAYLLMSITANKPEGTDLPGLLDPFAINTINRVVEHWTLTDRNTMMLPVGSWLIYNRLIWMGAGVIALVVGYVWFSFNVVRNSRKKKKAGGLEPDRPIYNQVGLPAVTLNLNLRTKFIQLIHHSFFYFTSLLKETPFWAITICGAAIIFVNGISLGTSHGVDSYPATYLIVEELQEMSVPFFLLILTFYSGELVWKERNTRINLIYDALPISNLVNVSSRFIGIVLAYTALLLALCVSGVLLQTLNGYYQYDLLVYFTGFFVEVLPSLILYTFVSFLFQVMINHKFLAQLATLLFVMLTLALETFGYDHDLIRFGGDTIGVYSEMNGYGHFLAPYLWIKSYWLAIGSLMLLTAVLFFVRGTETSLRIRWRMSKPLLTRSIVFLANLAALTFIVTGCYIFYNTNILNHYHSRQEQGKMKANYERTLKRYEYMPQPVIVAIKLTLDLYPLQREYTVEGQYLLVNKDSIPIKELHLQKVLNDQIKLESVTFDKGATKRKVFEPYGYTIYTLDAALQPGDSIKLAFRQQFETNGFVEGESVTDVVYNGTYLRNTNFPSLGYNRYFELTDEQLRKEFKLSPRINRAKKGNLHELQNGGSGGDGYEIGFEIIISTDSSQVAVAPGNLKKEWVKGNRRYFHYQMDQPMINFYSIVSAEYEVLHDRWAPTDSSYGQPIDLEIYYHKSHTHNLNRMMKSMKASFDYYTRHFGPYAYQQMRIMEYPRYRGYAQSLPGTVPFSEALGFILHIDDDKNVDMAFYITAHELAHQWWGLQVVAANVEGRDMILESLAQYSALMVMKAAYGDEKVEQFLRTQLKEYLSGRTADAKRERPLALAAGDPYIHYNKGALTLYALQDYISEEKVNLALKRFIKDWNAFGGSLQRDRYVTTEDLLGYFRAVTPDTLQNVITDLFETITIYDNKVVAVRQKKLSENKYKLYLTIQVLKHHTDSLGVETSVRLRDWIDIGVYAKNENGKDELIYLNKQAITEQITNLEIVVDRLPSKAGIDPRHLMIDKNGDDNVLRIK
jgi:ABC-2 type transport system permease protein